MSNGSRATIRITKPTGNGGSGSTPRPRIASSTSASRGHRKTKGRREPAFGFHQERGSAPFGSCGGARGVAQQLRLTRKIGGELGDAAHVLGQEPVEIRALRE